MESEKFELEIILKPRKQNQINSELDESWLDNNNPAILNQLNPIGGNFSCINTSKKKQYQVESIKIKQIKNEYQLYADNAWVFLQHGDVIVIEQVVFDVEIQKKQILMNPEPALVAAELMSHSIGDGLWQETSSHLQTQHLLNQSLIPIQETVKDPLTFLFDSSVSSTNDIMTSLIPQTTGIGSLPYDSIASIHSPMPTMTLQKEAIQVPSLSSKSIENVVAQTVATEGNILRDLGINQATSNYATAEFLEVSAKKLPAEHSPMDYLEDLLRDDVLGTVNRF